MISVNIGNDNGLLPPSAIRYVLGMPWTEAKRLNGQLLRSFHSYERQAHWPNVDYLLPGSGWDMLGLPDFRRKMYAQR